MARVPLTHDLRYIEVEQCVIAARVYRKVKKITNTK